MRRFSLVLATVGREGELRRLLDSLDTQTYRGFELIVVDQNEDDRLESLLARYRKRFAISHLRSGLGLSRARNVGLEHVSGDIVAFPDDDCWYPPDLLEHVAEFLGDNNGLSGVTGRAVLVAPDGEQVDATPRKVGEPRYDKRAGLLNRGNVWLRTCSYTVFLRRSVVERVGKFDETLGVGAGTPWGSAEDIDYPLRAVEAGLDIYYAPEMRVFHPVPPGQGDADLAARAYSYGAGMGRVLRKHDYPLWFVAYHLSRPLGGAALSWVRGQGDEMRYHLGSLRGRFAGWRSS